VPATQIRELAEGGYVERAEPVLLIGECGTANSSGERALRSRVPAEEAVRFTTAAALITELVEAKQQGSLSRASGDGLVRVDRDR